MSEHNILGESRRASGYPGNADNRWMDRGLCRTEQGNWYPTSSVKEAEYAVSVCGNCPVEHECLQYALRTKQREGIWGGTLEAERVGVKPGEPPRKRFCQNCGGRVFRGHLVARSIGRNMKYCSDRCRDRYNTDVLRPAQDAKRTERRAEYGR